MSTDWNSRAIWAQERFQEQLDALAFGEGGTTEEATQWATIFIGAAIAAEAEKDAAWSETHATKTSGGT